MKLATPFAALALFTLTAEIAPPRETGLDIPSAQSVPALAKCIEHRMGMLYKEVPLPNGGVSIEWGEQQSLFIHYDPALYFDLTDVDGTRHIVLRYRHPISKEAAAKNLRVIGRKCFPYELEAAGGGILPAHQGDTDGADKEDVTGTRG